MIPEVRPAAAPLVPADEGVSVGELIREGISHGGIGRGRTSVKVEYHGVGNIPSGYKNILLLPVERKVKLLVNAVNQIGITLYIVHIAQGNDR